jgi:hypothetical protein
MATTTPDHTTITTGSAAAGRSIRRTAAIAGVAAAVATTVIGAAAKAADVPLLVGELEVQVSAFAMFTLIGAALGGLLAARSPSAAAGRAAPS